MTGDVHLAVDEPTPLGGRPLAWATALVAVVALAALLVVGGIPLTISTVRSTWPVLAVFALVLLAQRVSLFVVRRGTVEVELRRFRLTDTSGTSTDCVLAGSLEGGRLDRGDVVDVFGRRGRDAVSVAEVVVPGRAERVHGRVPAAVLLVRSAVAGPAAVTAVCACSVLVILLAR